MRLERLEIRHLTSLQHVVLDLAAVPPGLVAIVGENGCLAGGTLIDVPRDLRTHPHGIPIRDLVGTEPLVYAYSHAEGRIVLARACNVRLTATQRPVFRVRYDAPRHSRGRFYPPTELVGTADHPVMLRDGTYQPLGTLARGDRLMPLYRRNRDGQYIWINRNDGTFVLEHRLVAGFSAGRALTDHEDAHHHDRNTFNNHERNCLPLLSADHGALHGREHPPHYTEHPRGMLGRHHTEQTVHHLASAMRRHWRDEDHRAQRLHMIHVTAARRRQPWQDRDVLLDFYVGQGKSTVQIAAHLGVSDVCVAYWLEKLGIPRRSLTEAQRARAANHVVLDVSFAGYEDVYDMEVPGVHNFVANGVVVHNSGKTTLLESVVGGLYRTLPSRGGELVDYATDRDATIDVRLAVDGVGAFHSRVNLDGIRRSTEAVLEFQGQPVSDGKVTTFDAEVRRRFPSLAVMLASAVAAQNKRGNFIQKKPKERKELFAEMLALGHLEEMSVTAKAALTILDGRAERLRATRTEVERVADPALGERYAADADRVQRAITTALGTRQEAVAALAVLEQRAQALAQGEREHAAAVARLTGSALELEARQAEQQYAYQEAALLAVTYEADQERLAGKARAAREAVTQKGRATEQDLDARSAAASQMLAQATAIRAAVASLHELDQRERTLRASLETVRHQQVQATDARAAIDLKLHQLAKPEHELQVARQHAMLIDTVPFGRRCAEAECQFLRDAIAGQAAIPALEQRLVSKAEWADAVAQLTETLTGHRATVDALSAQLGTVGQARASQQPLAALADKVTVAETRLAELTTARAEAERRLAARLMEMDTERGHAEDDLLTRYTAACETLHQQITQRAATLAGLRAAHDQATADAARTVESHRLAMGVEGQILETRRQAEQAGATLAALAVEEATITTARRTYHAACARRDRLTATLTRVETERLDWQQLHRALSRDGIPVLEMDAAGPRISELCNTLLTACFGPRFSVELVTQQAKTSGAGMKESFELLVTDNARGGEPREVGDLSGGEQVIVSEALMNAIALYVNEHAAMPIRTCWRDETTGALDTENAERYLQMLRQVLTLGSYHHIFFVTHNPAIAAQADAQIHLADGTAAVRLPPFAEAA